MCCDSVAEIGPDQRALDDLAKAVGDIDISNLQLTDGPHIVSANSSLRFALGSNGLSHVRACRHVLRSECTAGKWLLNMKSLPARIKLILIAVRAQKVPKVFNGHVHCPLEKRVRNLRTSVGESIALPVRGVKEHLIARHLHLAESRRYSQ